MQIPILHEDFTETKRILKQRPTPVLSVHGVLAAIEAAQFVIEDAGEGEEDRCGAGHELLAQDGGEGLLWSRCCGTVTTILRFRFRLWTSYGSIPQ
jgi:hypothetical protein